MSDPQWDGNAETYSDPEERRVLFAALDSFYQYSKAAHYNTTHIRRQTFYALPRAHWELLAAPPFSYLDTLNAIDDAIDQNAELATAILDFGLQSCGLGLSNSSSDETNDNDLSWQGTATPNNLEKARSTLRQFYRDWSEEGSAERDVCHGAVIRALKEARTNVNNPNEQMRVLVPGAGLGRLVFELCKEGFDVEGNEMSYHQLLASSYILNHCPGEKTHAIFPWVHSFSNHASRENHLRSYKIPDIHPGSELAKSSFSGDMSMSASDFLCLYEKEDQRDAFDVVATVFFLDTAPNIIRYIEVIRNCLKKGGLLVNTGPLLWHFENHAPEAHSHEGEDALGYNGIYAPGSVELTDDEVVALVEKMGFVIEKRESNIVAPYVQDPASMLHNDYHASHWVARKR